MALTVGVIVGDAVGLGKGVLVGGKVEVAKRGAGVGSFDEIETLQALSANARNKVKIKFFNMSKHHHLTLDLFDRVAGDLLFEGFTRQDRDFSEAAQ